MTQTKRGFVCVSSFCLVAKAPIFCFAEKRKNLQPLGGGLGREGSHFLLCRKTQKLAAPWWKGLVAKAPVFRFAEKRKNLQPLGGGLGLEGSHFLGYRQMRELAAPWWKNFVAGDYMFPPSTTRLSASAAGL